MTETILKGPVAVVAKSTLSLHLAYPDGSKVELIMPKPAGFSELSNDQAEMTLHRMASRLLSVASEDLASQKKGARF